MVAPVAEEAEPLAPAVPNKKPLIIKTIPSPIKSITVPIIAYKRVCLAALIFLGSPPAVKN